MYRNLQRFSKPRTSVRSCAGSSSTTMTSAKAHPDRRQPVDSAVLTRRLISGGMWRNCRPKRARERRGACENAPSLPRPRRPRPHRCRRCGRCQLAWGPSRAPRAPRALWQTLLEVLVGEPGAVFELCWGSLHLESTLTEFRQGAP